MKRGLTDILACPVCHSRLDLTVAEEKDGEIITGTLHCPVCPADYPIKDSIPDLLPPRK